MFLKTDLGQAVVAWGGGVGGGVTHTVIFYSNKSQTAVVSSSLLSVIFYITVDQLEMQTAFGVTFRFARLSFTWYFTVPSSSKMAIS